MGQNHNKNKREVTGSAGTSAHNFSLGTLSVNLTQLENDLQVATKLKIILYHFFKWMKKKILSSLSLTCGVFYIKFEVNFELSQTVNSEVTINKAKAKEVQSWNWVQSAFDSLEPLTCTFWGNSCSSTSSAVWDLLPGSQFLGLTGAQV